MNKNPISLNVVVSLMELADETGKIITDIFSEKEGPSQPISNEKMEKIQTMLKKAISGVTNTGPIDAMAMISLIDKFVNSERFMNDEKRGENDGDS